MQFVKGKMDKIASRIVIVAPARNRSGVFAFQNIGDQMAKKPKGRKGGKGY